MHLCTVPDDVWWLLINDRVRVRMNWLHVTITQRYAINGLTNIMLVAIAESGHSLSAFQRRLESSYIRWFQALTIYWMQFNIVVVSVWQKYTNIFHWPLSDTILVTNWDIIEPTSPISINKAIGIWCYLLLLYMYVSVCVQSEIVSKHTECRRNLIEFAQMKSYYTSEINHSHSISLLHCYSYASHELIFARFKIIFTSIKFRSKYLIRMF